MNSANAGADMEMCGSTFFGAPLEEAVKNGQVSESRIDDMVVRVLTPMFKIGMFDRPAPKGTPSTNVTSASHNEIARKLAAEGIVLLKNNGILPLDPDPSSKQNILVINDVTSSCFHSCFNWTESTHCGCCGAGSGYVLPPYVVSPFAGIQRRSPASNVTFVDGTSIESAVAAASNADIVVVAVTVAIGFGEAHDRKTLALGQHNDDLISALAKAGKKVIVALYNPGAVLLPWRDHPNVVAILSAFMPGQEMGNALADVLFGNVNPSGRLPLTFPVSDQDTPLQTKAQYPGINFTLYYTEKLNIGYRWFDAEDVKPAYEFGFGLSYSKFSFANLQIVKGKSRNATVSFSVTNRGPLVGSSVPQMYIGFPTATIGEPLRQLKGFTKVHMIKVGEVRQVALPLKERDFSIWDSEEHKWKFVDGCFDVHIGSSSRNFELHGNICNDL